MLHHTYISAKQQRKHLFKKFKKQSSNIRSKNKKRLNPGIRTIASIITIIVLTHIIFHLPSLRVHVISIEQRNDRIENRKVIEKMIQDNTYKKNYLSIKLFAHTYIKDIKEKYSFIKAIHFSNFQQWHLNVVIEHDAPNVMFHLNQSWLQAWSYNNKIFHAQKNYPQNDKTINITIPDYYPTKSLQGIFHIIHEEKLYNAIDDIRKNIDVKEFIYHIWGAKLIVLNQASQKIIFDLQTPIQEQIQKLIVMEKHYKDYKKVSEIDLGSTPQPIIKTLQ